MEPSKIASELHKEVLKALHAIEMEEWVREALYRDSVPVRALMNGLQSLHETYMQRFLPKLDQKSHQLVSKARFDTFISPPI